MGTNYYWEPKPPCECCGRPYDLIHIGKSSVGWCFSLHVYPEKNINNLTDWIVCFDGYGKIIDEYNQCISPDEMFDIITDRHGMSDFSKLYPSNMWYKSWEDFHFENFSEPGPNGLLRHQILENYCIGHGKGTYDYIIGEFC